MEPVLHLSLCLMFLVAPGPRQYENARTLLYNAPPVCVYSSIQSNDFALLPNCPRGPWSLYGFFESIYPGWNSHNVNALSCLILAQPKADQAKILAHAFFDQLDLTSRTRAFLALEMISAKLTPPMRVSVARFLEFEMPDEARTIYAAMLNPATDIPEGITAKDLNPYFGFAGRMIADKVH